jgi:hypothetical protein
MPLPGRFAVVASVCLVALGLAGLLPRFRGRYREEHAGEPLLPRLPHLMIVFALVYIPFLLLSITFMDAITPLDNRILSPLSLPVLFLSVVAGRRLLVLADGKPYLIHGTIAVCVAVGCAASIRAGHQLIKAHEEGLGYSSLAWRHSATVRAVNTLPSECVLFSNAPDAIQSLTGRQAQWLPPKIHSTSLLGVSHVEYSGDLAIMRFQMGEAGRIIYFSTIDRGYLPNMDELEKDVHLVLEASCGDGAIYRIQP